MSPRPIVFVFPFIALYFAAPVAADPALSDRKTSSVISHIPRQSVRSSALASVGYSKRLHILEIEFRKGAVYRYLDVPYSVYRNLMSAGSKARYYDRNIRGHYRSLHVHPGTKDRRVH
jgi:KTSC domain